VTITAGTFLASVEWTPAPMVCRHCRRIHDLRILVDQEATK
jgi:hypothetical protein